MRLHACCACIYCVCVRARGEWGGWGWSPSKSAKMSQYTQRTAPPQSHACDISLADTIESPLPSQSWPTGKVRSILHSKPAGGPRAFQGLSSFPGMRTTQTRVRSDLANCCRIHRPEVAVGHRKQGRFVYHVNSVPGKGGMSWYLDICKLTRGVCILDTQRALAGGFGWWLRLVALAGSPTTALGT